MADTSATFSLVQTCTASVTAGATVTFTFSSALTPGSTVLLIYLGGDNVNCDVFPNGFYHCMDYGVLATFTPFHYSDAVVMLNTGKDDDRTAFTMGFSGNTTGFGLGLEFTGPMGYLRPTGAVNTRVASSGTTTGTVGRAVNPLEETGSMISILCETVASGGINMGFSNTVSTTANTTGTITGNVAGGIYVAARDYTTKTQLTDTWSGTRSAPATGTVTGSVFQYIACDSADCYVNGWEFGTAYTGFGSIAGHWFSAAGSAGAKTSTTSKRGASSGSYGFEFATTTTTIPNISINLPGQTSWMKVQNYVAVHAKNTTGKTGFFGVGDVPRTAGPAGMTNPANSFQAGIGYDPATDKLYAFIRQEDGTVSTQGASSMSTVTVDQFYKVNMYAYPNSSGMNVEWYVDDVQQTTLTVSQPTGHSANMGGFDQLVLGSYVVSTTGTATMYQDDTVLLWSNNWQKWPLQDKSVVGTYATDAEGTHSGATSNFKSDTENPITSLTTTYQKENNLLPDDTSTYVSSIAATPTPESSYLEWEFASPSLGGLGTFYFNQTSNSNAGSLVGTSNRVLIGNETYAMAEPRSVTWPINAAPGNSGSNQGCGVGGQGNATDNRRNGWGGPKAKKPSGGGRYTSTDWDAVKVRFGYHKGTIDQGLFSIFYQHVEQDDPQGADHWGWAEGADDMDSFHFMGV